MNEERTDGIESADDVELDGLLNSLGDDAAAVDHKVIERANKRAADVFHADAPTGPARSDSTALPNKRNSVLAPTLVAFAVLVGAVALFVNQGGQASGDESFGQVLDRALNSESLTLRVVENGVAADVWVKPSGQVRWQQSESKYLIAKGTRLWRIDEEQNVAKGEESSWYDEESKRVDLLALIGISEGTSGALRKAMPQGRVKHAGRDCRVYRIPVRDGDRRLTIEAFADARTGELLTIAAWPIGKVDRNGPPLAELTLVARNEPLDESKFIVAKWLAEDGRIGKIADTQGIVTVKPVMHDRWTPITGSMLLRSGDWIRTDNRGANAVAVQMGEGTRLTLGPGSLVEMVSPKQARVIRGEVQIETEKDSGFALLDPDRKTRETAEKELLRVVNGEFRTLKHTPVWLAGFEGTQSNESLGSLIANVDGREVSLTVGYHKVTVEIRDQIARTTIEESFINHTDSRLEGVFYFPLPQDASISGFGMWIGNELVEADVVEKQRAREIYETIRRENRDPALLEWSGGNIFKASVFPIFAHSEKRIKITYTQVLPVRGGRYRYSYGLRSEMLKQKPLRELTIDLTVNSSLPIKGIQCPTHAARTDKTQHSGHVEFTAQEYTPERDFEVVVDIGGRQSDVVVIPHQRGDSGYFMLQLTPPSPDGNWQRDLLPDGQPLDLLIVADTSASMDDSNRKLQAEFVASLLASLGPKDKFNLAATDVDCQWAFKKSQAAGDKSIDAARTFLDERVSLGWTDLDAMLRSVLKKAGKRTHVVYVGDGIVTAGSADPTDFINRLERLVQGHEATFHAVTVGSSYEPVVLKAIASIGGGSLRQISGEQGPQAIALELLNELAQPGLRDLTVKIRGVQVARVYPDRLPNIAAGSQQIIIGRYLPEGVDQSGEVVVTGMRGEEKVQYKAKFKLADAERGNSFIPRLWARLHLDHLLSQGSAPEVRDDIIGLSEEYHIITPYTSLLVLESDADRERFKVKRRFQMRDGEKFFAAGRNNANFELKQKQMKLAGLWRQELRRRILQQFATLGRNATLLNRYVYERNATKWGMVGGKSGDYGVDHFASGFDFNGNGVSNERFNFHKGLKDIGDLFDERDGYGDDTDKDFREKDKKLRPPANPNDAPSTEEPWRQEETPPPGESKRDARGPFDLAKRPAPGFFGKEGRLDRGRLLVGGRGRWSAGFEYLMPGLQKDGESFNRELQVGWIGELFPYLPPAPAPRKPAKLSWSKEAVALSKSLLRVESLQKVKGGVRVASTSETVNVRWKRVTSRAEHLWLYSPTSWLSRPTGRGGNTVVNWCDAKQRGAFSRAYLLGRIRKSTAEDLRRISIGLSDHSLVPLHESYAYMEAKVEEVAEIGERIVLTRASDKTAYRILIDTKRHVVLEFEWTRDGKTTQKTTFSQFAEVAGRHWAQRNETFDKNGARVARTDWKIESLTAAPFAKAVAGELATRDQVQFLQAKLPEIAESREATVNERGTFEDHTIMLLHDSKTQQWKRVEEHLQAMETLAGDKPGMRWLRTLFLRDSRRYEELRKRLLVEAATLEKQNSSEDLFLAQQVLNLVANFAAANEQLELIDQLNPVFERQPESLTAMKVWLERRVNMLTRLNRSDEVIEIRQRLATDYVWDPNTHINYAAALINYRSDHANALAWLRNALKHRDKWTEPQEESIRSTIANHLQQQGRYADLLTFLTEWVALEPSRQTAYDRYLAALVWNDKVPEAEKLMRQWMSEAVLEITGGTALDQVVTFPDRNDRKLSQRMQSRLNSAVSLAIGQGYQHYTNRIESKWLAPLSKVLIAFARNKTHHYFSTRIMQQGTFSRSEESISARQLTIALLRAEIDRMESWELGQFLNWTLSGPVQTERDMWQEFARRLETVWAAEKDDTRRHAFGSSLNRLLSAKLGAEAQLKFLRRQLVEGPKEQRTAYANYVFNALTQQLWQDEYEVEAFDLLWKLSEAEKPGDRLSVVLPRLYQLTDRMPRLRYEAALREVDVETKANRIALRRKKQELWKAARVGYVKRLTQQIAKQPEPLKKWLRVEQVYLDIRLDRDLNIAARVCREALGATPPKVDTQKKTFTNADYYNGVLRHRYMITASYLATRKSTHDAMAAFTLKYIDAGIAQNKVDDEDKQAKANEDQKQRLLAKTARNLSWKAARYQMLIALDRPKDLEQDLRRWIVDDRRTSPWRLSLGRLLAEQGRIAEAIKLYEAVEHDDELTPTEYRALSEWHMVLNQREQYEAARLAYYKTMNEYAISNFISAQRRLHQRTDGTAPANLDPEVLLMFRALFEKSSYPQNYLWQLGQLYASTHDFRLLESLPRAVIGQTASKIYGFLNGLKSVTSQIQEEATIDSIIEHLAEVRAEAKTDIDRRALDLLVLMAERRAAELENEPGPHVDVALKAMQRAFSDHQWAAGEQRLMATFLVNLGHISQKSLADEQIRQLRQLHAWTEKGSFPRLTVGTQLAYLIWRYGRRDEALTLYEAAITEYDNAHDRRWPQTGNSILGQYVTLLESAGRYASGETFIQDHLTRPASSSQSAWFGIRLDVLYQRALDGDGRVSLGEGFVLYGNLRDRLLDHFDGANDARIADVVNRMTQLFRTGHKKNFGTIAADLRKYAFTTVPGLLDRMTNNYRNVILTTAQLVHDLLGPEAGVLFLVDRIENEPPRFRYRNDYAWNHHAGQLAHWRYRARTLDFKLEERLLKIVVSELRRDLIARQQSGRYLYSHQSSYFWAAKKESFRKTAEDVLKAHNKNGESVTHIAWYFSRGLRLHNRAIEIMFEAHRAKRLNDSQIATLVNFLIEAKQWGQTIALLEPLVERYEGNLTYRTQLMRAYFYTKRPMALLALLAETDEFFHQENRWTESVMVTLAPVCYETQLYEQSVKYFGEAIGHHQRTQPNRGIGNGTLSHYFSQQANAYEKLKRTKDAVDAAASAIVSWGRNQNNRTHALATLTSILQRSADRDAYAIYLDEQAEREAQERPIVRKALGKAYYSLKQYDRAVAQLRIAVRFQPNDRETHDLLISCFEAQKDNDAVIGQLLAVIQLDRREEALYRDLGQHLDGKPQQQERAYTAMVEMKPHESESHAALAQIRQQQDRWNDAIHHWQHVARIRSLEPTGLLKTAEAQIHQKQWSAVNATLDQLDKKNWPSRFGNVRSQTSTLRRRIPGEKR